MVGMHDPSSSRLANYCDMGGFGDRWGQPLALTMRSCVLAFLRACMPHTPCVPLYFLPLCLLALIPPVPASRSSCYEWDLIEANREALQSALHVEAGGAFGSGKCDRIGCFAYVPSGFQPASCRRASLTKAYRASHVRISS